MMMIMIMMMMREGGDENGSQNAQVSWPKYRVVAPKFVAQTAEAEDAFCLGEFSRQQRIRTNSNLLQLAGLT